MSNFHMSDPHFRFTLVYVLSRNRQIFISLGETMKKGKASVPKISCVGGKEYIGSMIIKYIMRGMDSF